MVTGVLTKKVLLAIVDKYQVRCNKDSTFIQWGVFCFHECGHKWGNCITVSSILDDRSPDVEG